MSNRLTKEEINRRLEEAGKIIRFVDSEYRTANEKYLFRCDNGHEFRTRAVDALRKQGYGCKKCYYESNKLTIEEINEELRSDNRNIEFIDSEYIDNNTKHLYRCYVCNHEWLAKTRSVLRHKKTGCPNCRKIFLTLTIDDVRKRLKSNGKGILLLDDTYGGGRHKYNWACPRGHTWKATGHHVLEGQSCPACVKDESRLTIKEINERLADRKIVFADSFYKNTSYKHNFECLECGNVWKTATGCVVGGTGCPKCANYGFDGSSPAILYYIKIKHRNKYYYKIGVTNRTVEDRFRTSQMHKIEILKSWKYEFGKDAYKREQRVLKKHYKHLYSGSAKILKDGMTEIFTKDVLELDGGKSGN